MSPPSWASAENPSGRLALGAVVCGILLTSCFSPSARPDQGVGTGRPAQPDPLVYRGQLTPVLPRDAIPSIDRPRFIPPQEAGWVSDREPVVSLELDGDARAYPVQILTRHEIVNDEVGGRAVAVTYCPLCNSALVFDRTVDGRRLEFGVSGKLYRSALVMYDRQTGSLWTQFEGLAVQGPLTGKELESLPAQLLSFGEWQRAYPAGRVLSRQTGFDVDYGTNPYEYYDRQQGPYTHFFRQPVNFRLPAMARVVGLSFGRREIAYPYRDMVDRSEGAGVINDRIGGRPVVILWRAGTASALDTAEIAKGRDVGATGVFSARVGSQTLTFAASHGRITDRETGSEWSVPGRAQAGPLDGARLQPLVHLDTFWFAWQAYFPDTAVYGHSDRGPS